MGCCESRVKVVSAGEGKNDAEDDPRDHERDEEDQAENEEADRTRAVDGEDAVQDVADTEGPQRRAGCRRRGHRLHERQCYEDGL